MTAAEVAGRLDGRRSGDGWIARCPAHEDRNPSLSIAVGTDGRVLLKCHAGCEYAAIAAAVGAKVDTLAAETRPYSTRSPIASYLYRNTDGRIVLTVHRWPPKFDGAKVITREPRGVRAEDVPVYRLAGLSDAARIWIVEGERDADALAARGLAATCNAGGAGKWLARHTRQVLDAMATDADIVVIPDLDEPGKRHAADVAAAFYAVGCAVRVLILPFDSPVPKGADVSDWLARGGTAEQLQQLADPAPVWTVQPNRRPPSTLVVQRADTITPRPLEWMWPGRIARGKTTLIAGQPGTGKSQLTCAMAAAVTTGGRWPDGSTAPLGRVVILNAEDEAADTIVPRLAAAGADRSLVHIVTAVRDVGRNGQPHERGLHLERDVAELSALVGELGNVVLVSIDPITAYLGGIDTHRTSDVRAVLAPLEQLAQRHRVAVVSISHLNKGGGSQEAMARVTGSGAFVAAARAAFLVARDPDDDARRLFLHGKSNLSVEPPGLAYTLAGVTLADGITTSRVEWAAGTVDVRADDVLAAGPLTDTRTRAVEAKDWLSDALAKGSRLRRELEQLAKRDGLAMPTVERAARALGVTMGRVSFGGPSLWTLPAPVASINSQSHHVPGVMQLAADDVTAAAGAPPGAIGDERDAFQC